jgi:hypothetical protein
MTDPRSAELVLADWRETAAVLRAAGHTHDAELYDRCASEISAAEPVRSALEWLSEGDAMLRSGYKVEYFRSRFHEWERQGLAEKRHRVRYYRAIVVSQRRLASVARLAGLRGERIA